jgi:O-antigen ligase
VLALLTTGVYYTYTKTAYAGVLLALLGASVARRWKISLAKTTVLLACILGIIVFGIRQMEHRGDDILLATFYARQLAWDASLVILADPRILFFGGGLGEVLALTGMHPHNIFLYLLVGYGLIGTTLLGGACFLFLYRLVERCRAHAHVGGSIALWRTSTLLFLYLTVTALFESIILGIHQRLLMAFVGALLLSWPAPKSPWERVTALDVRV